MLNLSCFHKNILQLNILFLHFLYTISPGQTNTTFYLIFLIKFYLETELKQIHFAANFYLSILKYELFKPIDADSHLLRLQSQIDPTNYFTSGRTP